MQAKAILEDDVEMISDQIEESGEARVIDIAQRMGVTYPTATKTVVRLKREGLANSRPYRGVFLTDDGLDLADQFRARHRTVIGDLIASAYRKSVQNWMLKVWSITYQRLL